MNRHDKTGFHDVDGHLWCESVALADIAAAVGTPAYVYSLGRVAERYRAFAAALADLNPTICYAMKANGSLAILRTLSGLGAGADVVSVGEMRRALAAGIPAGRIVFSGVGKTRDELAAALRAGIWQINVESIEELEALAQVASGLGVTASVALRINPDVDALTHAKISTGKRENKFGIDWHRASDAYALAARLPGIRPVGLAVHIGSQLVELAPYRAAFTRLGELVLRLRSAGLPVERLDIGGGLGVSYRADAEPPDLVGYAEIVRSTIGALGCHIACEPGRWMVADAGVLVTRTIYVKRGDSRRFVIVDAAMNDLIRPALYEAWHEIRPVAIRSGPVSPADVVGPVCESADTFAVDRLLPPIEAGDLLVLLNAGAYGAVMSSTYNARPLVPEVVVAGDRFAVSRPRPSVEEMLAAERVPDWLDAETGAPTAVAG